MIVFRSKKKKEVSANLNNGKSWSAGFNKDDVILEKRTREMIDKILNKYKAWHFAPVNFGMGRDGVPDVIACYKGHFIGIEAKGWKTGHKLTTAQAKTIEDIKAQGGKAIVINPFNLDELDALLGGIK